MTEKTTTEVLLTGLAEAIAERGPGWKYPDFSTTPAAELPVWFGTTESCIYSKPDGTPACIVGLALDKAKMKRPTYGFERNSQDVIRLFKSYPADYDEIEPEVVLFLHHVQAQQDGGTNWGDSVLQEIGDLNATQAKYFKAELARVGVRL